MEKNLQLIEGVSELPLFQAENFTKTVLSAIPQESEIAINKAAKGAKFLPISFVENTLDEIFFGAWETTDFKCQVVANEIIGWLQLRVYHPILKIWISRTGCAAVQIQMTSKQNGGDGDITNVRNKIINTLEKDFPHLKAECLKNAARSLGKIFGRDLNRTLEDNYTPITEQIKDLAKIDEIKAKLNICTTIDDLGMLFETLEDDDKSNVQIKKLFTVKKNQINYAKK
jgi:hypothetical protein